MNYKKENKNNTFYSLGFITRCLSNLSLKNGVELRGSLIKWELEKSSCDFSSGLMVSISAKTKKTIEEVFSEVKNEFSFLSDDIEIFKVSGGHLKFRFNDSFYKNFINRFFLDPFPFSYKKNIKVNVEFVSVNPTGYLHLGHLRNAVVGNTISNIYRFTGFDVSNEYYINDRGKQISDLVKSAILFYKRKNSNHPIDVNYDDLPYGGKPMDELIEFLSEKFNHSEVNEENENFCSSVVKFFLDKIKSDLETFGIYFDRWFSEKEMYFSKENVEKTLNFLSKKNFTYKENNAIFLKTSLFYDEKDRVIIKEDKDFTYFFSDIVYHLDKLNRSDVLIDVWGSDHHGHIERLKSSLKMFGFDKVENDLKIVLIQMISLITSDGKKKFSKRLGTSINVEDVENLIKKDQLKFCFLENDYSTPVSIDVDALSRENEKSKLYYIQYANARCNSLITKWKQLYAEDNSFVIDKFLLKEKKERDLLSEILFFENVVMNSLEKRKTHLIARYLYSLSSKFHSYYQSFPILKSGDFELTKQRIMIVFAVKKTIENGLRIFSIEPIDFMN